jgi:Icc-related predicted phosphoesterase
VLLLAGDLTQLGTPEQAKALAGALAEVRIPVVAVLGNHDHQADEVDALRDILVDNGVHLLEGEGREIALAAGGVRLGIAGVKGFGGGFRGACGSEFGEWPMKWFMRSTRLASSRLRRALGRLSTDYRVALLHYAPVPGTLRGERREIYPFLGSHQLGDAVDEAGADLVIHGHAHAGREKGATEQGIPIRNVAVPVIGKAYRVYGLPGAVDCSSRATAISLG